MTIQTSRRSVVKGAAWAVPAVAAATAAPAFAASPGTPKCRLRASIHGRMRCRSKRSFDFFQIRNDIAVGSSPLGFTYVNEPVVGGSKMSPETTIKLASMQLVVGLWTELLHPKYLSNPFQFTGATKWQLAGVSSKTMTDKSSQTREVSLYTFNFTGSKQFSTVPDVTRGGRPKSWPGSTFCANVRPSPSFCGKQAWMWAGYIDKATAANGSSIVERTFAPQWVQVQ